MAEPQTVELSSLVQFQSGGTPSRSNASYWNGTIPWISGKDMKSFRLSGSIEHISEVAAGKGTRLVQPGTLLVLVRGMALFKGVPVGLVTCASAFNQDIKALAPAHGVDPVFLAYAVAAREHQLRSFVTSAGHGTGRLITEALETLPIWVPPLPEQRRIAAVLDAWDDAIATAEKLIAVKERRKSAIAIQLLGPAVATQASNGWKTFRLGELFDERNETRPHAELLSITANRGIIRRDETDRKDSSAADKSKYKRVRVGDIGYNTMRMWQGVSALSSLDGIVSPAYTIATPKAQLAGDFAAHLFKLPAMIHLFWRYSQGLVDDTLSLKYPHFSQIKISIPPREQQTEIARCLNSQDDEISQLEEHVSLLRRQKRGLMQKLLTGEWRVPESIDALLPKAEVAA